MANERNELAELRSVVESLWIPLFVAPWVVGAVTLVAIVGNAVYRLAGFVL